MAELTTVAQRKSYRYDKRIEYSLNSLEQTVCQEDYLLVQKYIEQMVVTSNNSATISKNVEVIATMSKFIDKRWPELTKDDINSLVAKIMKKYSDNGQESHATYDCKKVLKLWFRFVKLGNRLHKKVGTPDELRDIVMTKVKNRLTHSDLITHDELDRILRSCQNSRDRAMFHFLYESGVRIGELVSIQRKHVIYDEDSQGFVIKVPESKTTIRDIAIELCQDDLITWYNEHPNQDSPEAYLFIVVNQGKNFGNPLTEAAIRLQLGKIVKRAKITKRIYPHLFRHSSATEYVPKLGYYANDRMGWSADSRMAARYVHLNQTDKNLAYRKLHKKIEIEETPRQSRICKGCKNINSPLDSLCGSCGRPLTLEARIQTTEKRNNFEKQVEGQIKTLANSFSEMQSMMKLFSSFVPQETKELPKEISIPLEMIPEELRNQLLQKLNQ